VELIGLVVAQPHDVTFTVAPVPVLREPDEVAAGTADDYVCTRARGDLVSTGASAEHVAASTAKKAVVARTAVQATIGRNKVAVLPTVEDAPQPIVGIKPVRAIAEVGHDPWQRPVSGQRTAHPANRFAGRNEVRLTARTGCDRQLSPAKLRLKTTLLHHQYGSRSIARPKPHL
jgi:hypothetical protein